MDAHAMHELLRNKFNLRDFREHQEHLVRCAINGENIYCCLPTGSGKSLAFTFETAFESHKILVIQPLLALLMDFSRHLTDLKIKLQKVY